MRRAWIKRSPDRSNGRLETLGKGTGRRERGFNRCFHHSHFPPEEIGHRSAVLKLYHDSCVLANQTIIPLRHAIGMVGFFPIVVKQEKSQDQVTQIKRVFRKKQSDTYDVELDTVGPSGSAHYDYQIRMQVSGNQEKDKATHFAVTFNNLRGTIGDKELPTSKVFGVTQFDLDSTGWPQPMTLVGANGPFLTPLLSFYLPGGVVDHAAPFPVSEIITDGALRISGADAWVRDEKGHTTLKMTLALSPFKPASSEMPKALAQLDIETEFDQKSGSLVASIGHMKGFGGSLDFKLKRR